VQLGLLGLLLLEGVFIVVVVIGKGTIVGRGAKVGKGVGLYAKCDDTEGNRFTLLQPYPGQWMPK
jgi:hypothetical protein